MVLWVVCLVRVWSLGFAAGFGGFRILLFSLDFVVGSGLVLVGWCAVVLVWLVGSGVCFVVTVVFGVL